MIEILAASVIWLFALTIYLLVRKLRKPKPVDGIKLQKIHLMRLGPFSGQSNSFKGKSVIFMMLLSTLSYADVSITTLSNWYIGDLSEDSLLITKGEPNSIFGFHIARPYCISEEPVLMLKTKVQFSDGDRINALIKVDKNKPKPLRLKKEYGFEDKKSGQYATWWAMKDFPSFDKASHIQVDFKATTPLKDFSIDLAGIQEVQYHAQQICLSGHVLRVVSKQVKI